jgi:hypothetical protein
MVDELVLDNLDCYKITISKDVIGKKTSFSASFHHF